MHFMYLPALLVLMTLAIILLDFSLAEKKFLTGALGVGCLILALVVALFAVTDTKNTEATRKAKGVQTDGKARLYFVAHYPDLEVLQFDTYRLLVRYERQNPRRVCKASLIPDGKIFLLGDDQICSVPSQGG